LFIVFLYMFVCIVYLPCCVTRVATFSLSQSRMGSRMGSGAEPPADGHPGVSPPENFCNSYVIWCILTQSGGSYLQAAGPSTFVALQ